MRPVLTTQHALVVFSAKNEVGHFFLFTLSTQDRSDESEESKWKTQRSGGLTTPLTLGGDATKSLRLVSTVTLGP